MLLKRLFTFSIITILLNSCSYYSFSGSGQKKYNSISILSFENVTLEYGLKEILTDEITNKFISDNNIKIIDQKNAEILLTGKIIKIKDEPFTYTANEIAKENKITLTIEASLKDIKNKNDIWQIKSLDGWGTYSISSGDTERNNAIKKASQMIAEELLNRIVSNW